MKYLAIFLGSTALMMFLVAAIVDTRTEALREELENRPASDTELDLSEFLTTASKAKIVYGLVSGTVLGAVVSALWWIGSVI